MNRAVTEVGARSAVASGELDDYQVVSISRLIQG
jgi:hypothetical protein